MGVVEVAAALDIGEPVFLSDCSFDATLTASLFDVFKWSRPAFSSEYLLASLRNLSANDNELALSISSNDRLWIPVLPFLSSSVMPNPYMQSLCIGFDCIKSADNLDDVNVWLLVLLSPAAAVHKDFVGDAFIVSISKSVFLFAVDDWDADITAAGTFIVTDVDVVVDDDDVDDDEDDEFNADDRLFGSTNVTDVTISSSSMDLIVALVAVSLAVTLGIVAFPFCTHFNYGLVFKCN